MLLKKNGETIMFHHKEAIDRMFGADIATDEMRNTYAVGCNSEYRYDSETQNSFLIINKYYVSKKKHRDSEQDIDQINTEILEIKHRIDTYANNMAKHYPGEDEIILLLQEHKNSFIMNDTKEN